MYPVVALVGRPNVGKSTLFNALTRSKDALVVDLPGTTRDRQYGEGNVVDKKFIVIDTGGIGGTDQIVDNDVTKQSWLAIEEADLVLFMVDAQAGLTHEDLAFGKLLRKSAKPTYLIVNKTDGLDLQFCLSDFYSLGFAEPIPIAANKKRGVTKLVEHIFADYVTPEQENAEEAYPGIRVAFVGQPNVGKSTLINRILGEERVIVSDLSGTTRDSIFVPFTRNEQEYTLIDTAGVRRKAKVRETVEKFSVVKTLQTVEAANVVVLLLDATRGVTDQDLHLLDFIISAGRAIVIAINKWDSVDSYEKEQIKKALGYRLQFAEFAIKHYISALKGTGISSMFSSIQKAYKSAMKELPTSMLTKLLEEIVTHHQPPLVNGRRIKLRYAHTGGHNPPRIIIHGNLTDHVPESYKRYMIKAFIDKLKLQGTPIFVQFKTGDNPYADKKNLLTPRQQRRRQRLMKHVKKK